MFSLFLGQTISVNEKDLRKTRKKNERYRLVDPL